MAERRKLCAILFVDIVGYTALMATSEAQAMAAVRKVRSQLRVLLPGFNGELVKELGDGYLCVFKSSLEGASCALCLQQYLANETFQIRMGMHLGDVISSGKDVYGDGVNIAARIESEAQPSSVLVSDAIARAIGGHENFELVSLGEREFKNVTHPIIVHQLSGEPFLPDKHPRRWPAIAIATALAVGIGAAGWWLTSPTAINDINTSTAQTYNPSAHDLATIAVLPFSNLSAESETDYFSDGLSEEMILNLSRIDGLRVSARTSSFQFRDTLADPSAIAAQLRVRYLLTGSVRRAGERIRIVAELVDTETGSAIWQESFERTLSAGAIFDVQDDIAIAVASEIPALLQLEKPKSAMRGTDSLAAYEAFLRARETLGNTLDARKERVRWLEIALELDPYFIDAEIILSHQQAFMVGAGLVPFEEGLLTLQQQVDDYFLRGLRERTDVLRFAGYIAYLSGDIDGAEAYYLEGLAIEPNHLGLLSAYASILSLTTRNDQASAYRSRLFDLDPLNPNLMSARAFHEMYTGNFEEHYASCQALFTELNNPGSSAYCLKNHYAFVTFEFDRALAIIHEQVAHTPLGHYYFNAATITNYLHATSDALAWSQAMQEPFYRFAMQGTTEWVQGDTYAALESLTIAYEAGRQQTALTPLAQLLMTLGRYQEAIDLVSTLSSLRNPEERLDRTQIQSAMVKAYSLRALGEHAESEALFQRILHRVNEDDLVYRGIYGIVYTRAEVFALMGKTEEALVEIEKLQADNVITLQHSTLFGYTPKRNPYFNSLTNEPRFQDWLDHLERQRENMRQQAADYLTPPE